MRCKKLGGNFNGDTSAGNFDITIMGNTITGSYNIAGNQINITVDDKPFFVPCSTIESFLKSKLE